MYGYPTWDEATGEIDIVFPDWHPFLPELTLREVITRRVQVSAFLDKTVRPWEAPLRAAALAALNEIVAIVPDAVLDFAMYMALAHLRLVPAELNRRAAAIDRIPTTYACDLPDLSAAARKQLGRMKALAILAPDAMLEMYLHSFSAEWRIGILADEKRLPATTQLLQRCDKLYDDVLARPHVNSKALADYFHQQLWMAPAADAERIYIDMQRALQRDFARLADQMIKDLEAMPVDVQLALRLQTGCRVIADLANNETPGQCAQIVTLAFEEAMARQLAFLDRVFQESLAAALAGVSMGPEADAHVRRYVLQVAEQAARAQAQLAADRLKRKLQPRSAAGAQPGNTPVDIDPVHAWSVERLVQWIDGPVTGTSGPLRIDRQAIAQREAARRKEKAVPTPAGAKQQPQGAVAPEPDLSANDVNDIVEEALAATARFFLADIEEVKPLALELHADPRQLQVCAGLQDALNTLAQKPSAMNEAEARHVLTQAENSIAALRKTLRKAGCDERLQRCFAVALASALAKEPRALGRRQGGVIGCALKPADWSWVAERFHHRWLPQVRLLIVDGERVPLQADQALALYVTGSSQSQYAFDISVHLWRRRPGCTSPPGPVQEEHPPMNEVDWFDTYIPCCVLHVPPA